MSHHPGGWWVVFLFLLAIRLITGEEKGAAF
jgi:hypothetical protein